ncbi:small nuclear RNA activating complex, subunit SNAP43-domain-containing protein [Entophlyctis helioformis]|nr:small nuclear RNA activating complex, subunit SNAP43-domain-containing protein [Entophlyctis helioformis]
MYWLGAGDDSLDGLAALGGAFRVGSVLEMSANDRNRDNEQLEADLEPQSVEEGPEQPEEQQQREQREQQEQQQQSFLRRGTYKRPYRNPYDEPVVRIGMSGLRLSAIRGDVRSLLNQFFRRNSTSLQHFREDWISLGFSRIHTIVKNPASKERDNVLTAFYSAVLGFLSDTNTPFVKIGIAFALYAMYFSQPCTDRRIVIRLHPTQMEHILGIHRTCTSMGARDGVAVLNELFNHDAFAICIGGIPMPQNLERLRSQSKYPEKSQAPAMAFKTPDVFTLGKIIQDVFTMMPGVTVDNHETHLDRLLHEYSRVKASLDPAVLASVLNQPLDLTASPRQTGSVTLPQDVDVNMTKKLRQKVDILQQAKRQRLTLLAGIETATSMIDSLIANSQDDAVSELHPSASETSSSRLANVALPSSSPLLASPALPSSAFSPPSAQSTAPQHAVRQRYPLSARKAAVPHGADAIAQYRRYSTGHCRRTRQ